MFKKQAQKDAELKDNKILMDDAIGESGTD